MNNQNKTYFFALVVLISVSLGMASGLAGGYLAFTDFTRKQAVVETQDDARIITKVEEESAVIDVVEQATPAVVSIIVTKDLPVWERYYEESPGDFFGDFFGFRAPQYRQKGTEEREIGGGSGFIVSTDGYIVTNKHVVDDPEADYTVLVGENDQFEAEVLARDTYLDLAILKIDKTDLPYLELGDSSNLKVGQSVVAIGNALAEFRNTVSVGVISGLSRSVVAGGLRGGAESLTGLIQTDASINPGNSGGPLLNLAGQVIGINTAMAGGAENIGFAIPVNEIKASVDSVRETGRIVRPWLGVRYVMLNTRTAEENSLDVDYGALIVRGEQRTALAVIPGSPADKAGLVENDIILEIDGERLTEANNLASVINQKTAGQEIELKILHKGKEKEIKLTLEERE